jgi:hypothetical protein
MFQLASPPLYPKKMEHPNMPRGRKSVAHLTMIKPQPKRLEPPPNMPPEELAVWNQIVGAMPNGFFTSANADMLRCLVSHIATQEFVAIELATARDNDDLGTIEKLTKIAESQSRSISNLSTKLRLTPRSRMGSEQASTRTALNSSTRPWEVKS